MPKIDIKDLARRFARLVNWPLLLIGPATIVLVYALKAADADRLLKKGFHEDLAAPTLGLALLLCVARWGVTRRPLFIILSYMTFALLCREIHFEGSDNFLYGSIPVIFAWMWLWRERTRADWGDRRFTGIFFAALFMYVLSQVIARRAFKFALPNEKKMHIPLEEFIETVGHLTLVAAYLLPRWRKPEAPGQEKAHEGGDSQGTPIA